VFETKLLPVSQESKKISSIIPTRDNQDIVNPGIDERLDGVVDHRLIVHGKKMLVGHLG
jgi:hypothetical protein